MLSVFPRLAVSSYLDDSRRPVGIAYNVITVTQM